MLSENIDDIVDEKVLEQNLDGFLFFELFTLTLESLKLAFEQFKLSTEYAILRENIRRQEKLY